MKAYAATNVGLERSINQDYIYYSLDKTGCLPNLFVVADGMGGHKAGDIASRFTVENLVTLIRESKEKDLISIVNNAISDVNERLFDKASESADYEGMGTTLVVATISDKLLMVANVGDSRLYIVNDDITQITRDHSLVEEMVLLGKLDRKAARTHEKKNYITRAIGGEKNVEAEMFSVDLKPGDRIIMCSDGLSNMVEDNDILNIVKHSDSLEEAVEGLIKTANDNGGKDNISVIIIEP